MPSSSHRNTCQELELHATFTAIYIRIWHSNRTAELALATDLFTRLLDISHSDLCYSVRYHDRQVWTAECKYAASLEPSEKLLSASRLLNAAALGLQKFGRGRDAVETFSVAEALAWVGEGVKETEQAERFGWIVGGRNRGEGV